MSTVNIRAEFIKGSELSHETMIYMITHARFNERPQYINRIAIGICNEVKCIVLSWKKCEIIDRLSPHNRFLIGSYDHIPKFNPLGIRMISAKPALGIEKE